MVVLSTFYQPDTPIHLEQRNTRAILDKKDIGLGTLFISESTLSWKDGEVGFALSYPNISLHAVSSDPNLYPTECIYVMIDTRVRIPGVEYEEDVADSDNEDSEADISELILVPEDPSAIQNVYEALKACQALNPDPEDVASDDDIYEDADEDMISDMPHDIGAGGDNEMDNLVNLLRNNSVEVSYDYGNGDHNNDDIFEDAD